MAVATITKTIGSTGRNFSTMQSWEDGAPVDLTTSEKWTAGTFSGTFQQGEIVTGTGLTEGKFLDSNQSSYVTFGIVTGVSTTVTTLTGSTSGATCVLSAKTDTGVIWRGEMYNDSVFTVSNTGLTVAGSTASSTTYKELTVAAGQSFIDVGSRALRYISGSGVSIEGTGSYTQTLVSTENYFRVSRIQVKTSSTGAYGPFDFSGTGVRLEKAIFENSGNSSAFSLMDFTGEFITNVLFVRVPTGVTCVRIDGGAAVQNCMVVRPGGGSTATGFATNYSGSTVYKNCSAFGFTTAAASSGTAPTYNNCYSDVASPPTGWTGSIAFSTATFNSITSGSENYRLVSGSALLDVGTTASNASTDIFDISRPQGSAYDIGPHELVSSSVFIPKAPLFVRQAVNRSNTY